MKRRNLLGDSVLPWVPMPRAVVHDAAVTLGTYSRVLRRDHGLDEIAGELLGHAAFFESIARKMPPDAPSGPRVCSHGNAIDPSAADPGCFWCDEHDGAEVSDDSRYDCEHGWPACVSCIASGAATLHDGSDAERFAFAWHDATRSGESACWECNAALAHGAQVWEERGADGLFCSRACAVAYCDEDGERPPRCGHSACRQAWIDGDADAERGRCIEEGAR